MVQDPILPWLRISFQEMWGRGYCRKVLEVQLDSRVDKGHWTLDSIVMFVFVSSLYLSLSFWGSGILGWLVLELTRDSLCLCIIFVFVFVFFRIGYCRLEEERCQRWNPIAELTGDSHLAGRATQISNFWISTKDPTSSQVVILVWQVKSSAVLQLPITGVCHKQPTCTSGRHLVNAC